MQVASEFRRCLLPSQASTPAHVGRTAVDSGDFRRLAEGLGHGFLTAKLDVFGELGRSQVGGDSEPPTKHIQHGWLTRQTLLLPCLS